MNTNKQEELKKLSEESKVQMIKSFTELLDKHCKTDSDVWNVLNALDKAADWLIDQRFNLEPGVSYRIKCMNDALDKTNEIDAQKQFFRHCTEMALDATLIANQQYEGLSLISGMSREIEEIMNI